MTGTTIKIAGTGDAIGQKLSQMAERAGDLHDALRELGEVLVPSTQARFDQAVAPDGTPWAPLSPRTLARKKGPGILRESLMLQGSIRYQVEAYALMVGTDLEYAAIDQFGGKVKHEARQATVYFHHDKRTGAVGNRFVPKKRANFVQDVTIGAHEVEIPARPYLGFSASDEAASLKVLEDYLAGD